MSVIRNKTSTRTVFALQIRFLKMNASHHFKDEQDERKSPLLNYINRRCSCQIQQLLGVEPTIVIRSAMYLNNRKRTDPCLRIGSFYLKDSL